MNQVQCHAAISRLEVCVWRKLDEHSPSVCLLTVADFGGIYHESRRAENTLESIFPTLAASSMVLNRIVSSVVDESKPGGRDNRLVQ